MRVLVVAALFVEGAAVTEIALLMLADFSHICYS